MSLFNFAPGSAKGVHVEQVRAKEAAKQAAKAKAAARKAEAAVSALPVNLLLVGAFVVVVGAVLIFKGK